MKKLILSLSLVFALAGCGGGGTTPNTTFLQHIDTYNGSVLDSRKNGYQADIVVIDSSDHPETVSFELAFYVPSDPKDPTNTSAPKNRYYFDPLISQYPDGHFPIVDSHIHASMALYPEGKSIYTTSPICNLMVDATVNQRKAVDVSYSSPDCTMIGIGTIHAPFISEDVVTQR